VMMAAVRMMDERHDSKMVADPRLELQIGDRSTPRPLPSPTVAARLQKHDVLGVTWRRPIRAGDLLEVQQVVF